MRTIRFERQLENSIIAKAEKIEWIRRGVFNHSPRADIAADIICGLHSRWAVRDAHTLARYRAFRGESK